MDKNSSQALAEVIQNWPQLLSKTIDDLSRMFALANLYQFRRELLPTELRCGL